MTIAASGNWFDPIWPYLKPALELKSGELPGLLSNMGVVNTVAVFAYTTVLGRVAGVKYRRRAALAFVMASIAVLCVIVAYISHSYWNLETSVLVDVGLAIWIASFAYTLLMIFHGARDVVGTGERRYERFPPFAVWSSESRFGVPFIDQVLRLTMQRRERVNFPFLLVHDLNSPGLGIAAAYVHAGLLAGEAVVYLTFSRPHSTVAKQVKVDGQMPRGLWIIDCYSTIYMPEEVRTSGRRVSHADPRDPTNVYREYMSALEICRLDYGSVRVVYETLSDFLKIADADLVAYYLRRTIVLEERRGVKAIYIFWLDAVQHQVDAKYLQWFFSAKLEIVMPDPMGQPATFQTTFSRFFPDPVVAHVGTDLRIDENQLFAVSPARAQIVGLAMRNLAFRPRAYHFLSALTASDRPRHVANFLFFMVAIDHDTHRPAKKFEDTLDGRFLHGSDLLYALAEQAKLADPTLFLPKSFRCIDDGAVAGLFTSPGGKQPADVAGRAEIFRACAADLIKNYGGDACQLIDQSNHMLSGDTGLIRRLKKFTAFSDPIGKKSALLVKLLIREGLFNPLDPAGIDVAVDHVVMTMALRSGLVQSAEARVRAAVESGTHLDQLQMDLLRKNTKTAMRELAAASRLRADEVDDLIWSYGRASLRKRTPLTAPAAVHSELDSQVERDELSHFVAVLNGLDSNAGDVWPAAQTVHGPFTRFY